MKKRLLFLLLCALCLCLFFPVAESFSAGVSAETAAEFEIFGSGLTPEDAFEGFILQSFGLRQNQPRMLRATKPLSGAGQILYTRLAEIVKNTAAGKNTSTVLQIPMSELGITKYSYTAEDLGMTSLFDGGIIPAEDAIRSFYSAVYADMGLDLPLLGRKLRLDFPYDMYWADNSNMTLGGFSYYPVPGEDRIYIAENAVFTYPIYVSSAYSVSGQEGTTEFDPSHVVTVQQAAASAKAVAARYSNASSDYGKLMGFKNAVCSLTDYNHEAAGNEDTPYGDPWQLVYVFDGDPDTKVVCEGYSKAFKYLCDIGGLSEGTSASIVTGSMSGGDGAGDHMWNLVSMDGVNYLVDVTNCDSDPENNRYSVGYPDELFMAGYSTTVESSGKTWYVYQANGNYVLYLFDDDIANLYAAEDIAASPSAHEKLPYILASAEQIELGESLTLTMSVPDQEEFVILYEKDGVRRQLEASMTYEGNEMSCVFTPEAVGGYVFYAGYYDEEQGTPVITDASVRVNVVEEEPDPLTVAGMMKVGTDVTVQIAGQESWTNLFLEIEYLPEEGGTETVVRTEDVSAAVSVIGTNFMKAGTYLARLSRTGAVPDGEQDSGQTAELASAVFRMEDQILTPTAGTLSAEEITAGDGLTFTAAGAEALACQLWMTDPVTGAELWETDPPLTPSAEGDTLRIDDRGTAGLLEGKVWAKKSGIWQTPQEIRVFVWRQPVQLSAEEQNLYFAAETAAVGRTVGTIVPEETEGLAGTPVWTVERTAGTAEVQAAWNGEAASVAVTSFPDAAENAEYTVRCVWGTAVWEKKYTVHFLDLSGKQSPRLRPAADGNFWTARAGEPLNPQNCFTVVCDWTPSGGKPFVISAEAGAAVLEHFTADPEAGTITPDDPGGYDFDLKLTLANVSWTVPYTLYVTREDGTVPAGSFRSQSGSTLNLPARLKRIGAWAFSGSSAEIVMIPEACTEIEDWAFSNMQNLREITIPSSVTVIGKNVFTGSGSFAVYAYSDAAVETALGYEGLLVLTE